MREEGLVGGGHGDGGGGGGGVRNCFVTCGDWDLMTGLPTQCRYQGLDYHDYLRKWLNIKVCKLYTGTPLYWTPLGQIKVS